MEGPYLRLPFNGDFPVSLSFGSWPQDPTMAEKFTQWGITGHHGIDFALPQGVPVLSSDSGKVIHSGLLEDFGNTIILEHLWGQSWYAHLSETRVTAGQEVARGETIGLSGQSGVTTGPHLHFAIKPTSPDPANGFLGFIDPMPFFIQTNEVAASPSLSAPLPPPPASTITPVASGPEPAVNQLSELRQKANEARLQKRERIFRETIELARTTAITNKLLQKRFGICRQTASNYLRVLVAEGKLEKNGKGRSTHYLSVE